VIVLKFVVIFLCITIYVTVIILNWLYFLSEFAYCLSEYYVLLNMAKVFEGEGVILYWGTDFVVGNILVFWRILRFRGRRGCGVILLIFYVFCEISLYIINFARVIFAS